MDFIDWVTSLERLPPFTIPTAREIQDWLRQTGGRSTAAMQAVRPHVHVQPSSSVTYTGTLTVGQQWWILDDLNATAKDEIVHHHVNAVYGRTSKQA
jgi:hypothetical protein